jgi:FKBP-type peptidyl-prolyl cis-trans isomerase FkpA
MEKRLIKVITGILSIVPFVVTSCMMSDGEDVPDFREQLQKDLNTIDDYLAANGIVADQDIDGLIRYVVHHDSTGNMKATIDSCATANYSGKFLIDGREFDKGTGFSFPLNGVIDGWKIGIPLLTVGDSATLYIPSGLAYGYYGFKPEIPSNANLVFHVGLKKVGTTYKPSDRSCD